MDENNGVVFSLSFTADAELFRAPGHEGVDGLQGLKTALDHFITTL